LQSAHIGLLRRDGRSPVRWIEIEPCCAFRCLNAYQDSRGRILVDLCQYSKEFDVSTRRADATPT
jgi:carotenoid cleavage dioxygenase-like enzyme